MELKKEKHERFMTIFAMKDGRVIGQISLVAPLHLEGVFVEPDCRGSMVMKQLVNEAEAEASAMQVSKVLAFAADEKMESYIARLGYKKMPLTVWEKELACPLVQ